MISDLLLGLIFILFCVNIFFILKTLYYKFKYHYYAKKYFGKPVVHIPKDKSSHEKEYNELDIYLLKSSKNGIKGFKWFFIMFSIGLIAYLLKKSGY